MQVSSSTVWSANLERSIQLTSSVMGYAALILNYIGVNPDEIYEGKISILNNSNSNVYLRLMEVESNQYNDVIIPPAQQSQIVTITRTITSTSTLQFTLIIRNPLTVYVDDVKLICKR